MTPQVMQIRLNSAFANCTFGCPKGVQTEAVEFRRAETGVTPIWTTMRFPGQQYDEETDFFSNNHRFYNPSVPRQYLQPEPMLQSHNWPAAAVFEGRVTPLYSYASLNPVNYIDSSGRFTKDSRCWNVPTEDELYNAVGDSMSVVKNPELFWCVLRQIERAHLTCNLHTEVECSKMLGVAGYVDPPGARVKSPSTILTGAVCGMLVRSVRQTHLCMRWRTLVAGTTDMEAECLEIQAL